MKTVPFDEKLLAKGWSPVFFGDYVQELKKYQVPAGTFWVGIHCDQVKTWFEGEKLELTPPMEYWFRRIEPHGVRQAAYGSLEAALKHPPSEPYFIQKETYEAGILIAIEPVKIPTT